MSCFLESQAQKLKDAISNAQTSVDSDDGYLFIERSFDDTPIDIPFGLLHEYLAPAARYVVPYKYREKLGKAYASYQDVLDVGIPPRMRHGVVDVFQETVTIDVGQGVHVNLLVPPRVMLGKSAGYLVQALQTTLKSRLSTEALRPLKSIVIMVLNGDSASQNRKAMFFIAQQLGANILVFPNRCAVHQLFRAVITVLERLDLVRPLFALTNVLNLSSRQAALRRAVAVCVTQNFDYQLTPAPPEDVPLS